MNRLIASGVLAAVIGVFVLQLHGSAQPPGPAVGNGRGPVAPSFMSPEVISDRRIAFRVFAPTADDVRLVGTDIPRNLQGIAMTKSENGVWEVTVGPLEPGAYRYHFNVNGVAVIDLEVLRSANRTITSGVSCMCRVLISWRRRTCRMARSLR